MLEGLSEFLNVRFEERTIRDDHGVDAWFLHEADHESLRRVAHSSCPSYATIRDDLLVPCGESSAIEFTSHFALPPILNGRRISADEVVNVKALPEEFYDTTIIASKAERPVWVVQQSHGFHHHCVSLEVPELTEEEPLFEQFNVKQFVHLLPLLLFIRTVAEDQRWEQPPLRACFMFDDPNLHWRKYGFIDFSKVAEHARMHNYHVSFAMIPLDTWFVHKPTASLFQQYRDQLSLLVHGNNHISKELGRVLSDEKQNRNLQHALRRIGEFERRSSVEVSKVMAPPHGAWSEGSLAEMAHLGYEAACISRGSLHRYNRQATSVRMLGMNPSDIIGGLPVLPRFRLSGSCHNGILVAALLHQPIILVGHHQDVAEGLQLLSDLSEFVNNLGTVRWSNMTRIARSHYAQRLDGRILLVRMFTRRIKVIVPEGTSHIVVERSRQKGVELRTFAWRLQSEGSEWTYQHPEKPIPVQPYQEIEIVDQIPVSPLTVGRKYRNFKFWPVVRRQLTEARDRLAPVIKGLRRSLSARPRIKQ